MAGLGIKKKGAGTKDSTSEKRAKTLLDKRKALQEDIDKFGLDTAGRMYYKREEDSNQSRRALRQTSIKMKPKPSGKHYFKDKIITAI